MGREAAPRYARGPERPARDAPPAAFAVKRASSPILPLCAASLAALVALAPAPAAAQSAKDLAAARQAFREGDDAEAKGDYARALARFQAALAVKETAQLHLRVGAVQEKMGKLVDALASYQLGLAKAASLPAVAKIAREQIEGLRPRIPTLTVMAQPLPGLEVTLDGAPIAPSALGATVPIDPGAHRLHAEAPGHVARDQAFTSTERAGARIELNLVADAPKPPPEAPASPKLPGALAAAAGGVALVAGAALIGVSVAKDGSIDALCGGGARDHCPLSKKAAIDGDVRAVNALRFSGVGVTVIGAAGAAVGTWLLVKATRPAQPASGAIVVTPAVGAGAAGVVVGGRF